ncbi:Hypothetical protein, putative, partial [Bodo saltans]
MGTGCSSLDHHHQNTELREDLLQRRESSPDGGGTSSQTPIFSGVCQPSNPLELQQPEEPSQPQSAEIELCSPLTVIPPPSPQIRTTVTNESFSSGTRHRKRLKPTMVQSCAKWTSTTERGAMPLTQSSQRSMDIRQWISDSSSFMTAENENDDGA